MTEDKKIPEFESYEEMAEFWDNRSLADYWDQTEPAEFEISHKARRLYLVSLDRNLLLRLQPVARMRGLSIESIVNLLIEQRLVEIGV
ncbi:MAG: CopG family antitoxin [Desulfococcaceae bacterium]